MIILWKSVQQYALIKQFSAKVLAMFEMAEVEHKLRQAESREFSAWRKRSEPCGFFVQIGFGVNAPFTNKRLKKMYLKNLIILTIVIV